MNSRCKKNLTEKLDRLAEAINDPEIDVEARGNAIKEFSAIQKILNDDRNDTSIVVDREARLELEETNKKVSNAVAITGAITGGAAALGGLGLSYVAWKRAESIEMDGAVKTPRFKAILSNIKFPFKGK